jgi:phage terminase large subunit
MEIQRREAAKNLLRDKMGKAQKPIIPKAYDFLYEQSRYKVVYGGRGKGASWSFARVLLYRAHVQTHRIMCTRDVQNSIEESVYELLVQQIAVLGYSDFYDITKTHIRSKVSGSVFFFRGLNDKTVDNAKSMEGVTIVWCAEAHKMGKKSWRVLTPTIRAGKSEIWVDYNPDAEDAPTHVKFTVNPPRNSIIRHINYDQNPFFPAELEEERQDSLAVIARARTDEEREQAQLDYDNVWLGMPRKISITSIFGARCYFEEFETPATAEFMHGADWGYANDPTALVRCFESPDGKELFIDREAFGYGVELDEIPALFDSIPTARKWRIEADSARPETVSHIKRKGFDIVSAEKWPGSVEDGIGFLKSYKRIVIHSTHCPNMVKEAKLYSWKLDKVTQEILPIPVDADNHGWDAVRYALGKRIKQKPKGFFS